MTAQRREQPIATAPEQRDRAVDIADRLRNRRGWFTVKELATELRFTVTAPRNPDDACRAWLRRHGIVGVTRGRVILIDSIDVQRALRKVS